MRSALLRYGGEAMALDYLNCGDSKLAKAAETWASRHSYYVMPSFGGGGGPSWGEGL